MAPAKGCADLAKNGVVRRNGRSAAILRDLNLAYCCLLGDDRRTGQVADGQANVVVVRQAPPGRLHGGREAERPTS